MTWMNDLDGFWAIADALAPWMASGMTAAGSAVLIFRAGLRGPTHAHPPFSGDKPSAVRKVAKTDGGFSLRAYLGTKSWFGGPDLSRDCEDPPRTPFSGDKFSAVRGVANEGRRRAALVSARPWVRNRS
jgi:hypothetical protein